MAATSTVASNVQSKSRLRSLSTPGIVSLHHDRSEATRNSSVPPSRSMRRVTLVPRVTDNKVAALRIIHGHVDAPRTAEVPQFSDRFAPWYVLDEDTPL